MQIQLRQAEIIAAIKQYVAKQGISLDGKCVEVAFTAGRKETGISADIVIDDLGDLPDLDGLGSEAVKPNLVLVNNDTAGVPMSTLGVVAEETTGAMTAVDAVAPKTTSLFAN